MRKLALGALAALALGAGGCATQQLFAKYFDEGLYQDAARAFEADSTLWSRPDALLRAARLYADPRLPVFDPHRAQEVIARLVAAFPESPEARQAATLLALLAQLEKMNADLSARSAELAQRTAQTDTLAASREAAEREVQTLRRQIQKLEADLEQIRLELEQTRQELERLKAIDLRRRPDNRR